MEIVAKQGEERLFWSLPVINEKYSKTVSKFFNDSYSEERLKMNPTFISRAKVNRLGALLKWSRS